MTIVTGFEDALLKLRSFYKHVGISTCSTDNAVCKIREAMLPALH